MSARGAYVERVRAALTLSSALELPRAEYIDALEELGADIDGMIEAAREEERNLARAAIRERGATPRRR